MFSDDLVPLAESALGSENTEWWFSSEWCEWWICLRRRLRVSVAKSKVRMFEVKERTVGDVEVQGGGNETSAWV